MAPRKLRADGGFQRRFVAPKAVAGNNGGLSADHPAVVEGRTLFPSTVVEPSLAQRVLVSGVNNSKLGRMVTKGRWKGFPIYQLTLEERATCPRTCAVWEGCYGNTMHLARRNAPGPVLETHLTAELTILQLKHPKGFVVRLHTLGDFYSTRYARFWEQALDRYPALHVFGFTAREPWTHIGRRVGDLSRRRWDRWAVRFSANPPVSMGSTVVEDMEHVPAGVVVCPAQRDLTECCATCGLCWAAGGQDLTIGFLRHGIKRANGPRPQTLDRSATAQRLSQVSEDERRRIAERYGVGWK